MTRSFAHCCVEGTEFARVLGVNPAQPDQIFVEIDWRNLECEGKSGDQRPWRDRAPTSTPEAFHAVTELNLFFQLNIYTTRGHTFRGKAQFKIPDGSGGAQSTLLDPPNALKKYHLLSKAPRASPGTIYTVDGAVLHQHSLRPRVH